MNLEQLSVPSMRQCERESSQSALSPCGHLVSHVDALVPLSAYEPLRYDPLGPAVPNGCKSHCLDGESHLQIGMAHGCEQKKYMRGLLDENALRTVDRHEKPVCILRVEEVGSSGEPVPRLDRMTVTMSASGACRGVPQLAICGFLLERCAWLGRRVSRVERPQTAGWRMMRCRTADRHVLRRDRNADQRFRNRVYCGGHTSRLYGRWGCPASRPHTSRSFWEV